jgi:D-lactate dehydrogenase
MSIYFFETEASEREYLTERLPGETIKFIDGPLTTAEQARQIAEDAEAVSVFVHSHLGPDVLDALPKLRLVTTRSTGFDHINLPLAESRAIPVCNVPVYGENTVAEHAFALILSLSRNLHKAYVRTAAGNFNIDGLQGFDLKGKTIGVVGTGHIGLHVIRIARGFDMKVVAYDVKRNSAAADLLGFEYTGLDNLLERSDIVTLHAPLTPESRHMIGRHNMQRIKPGAILINTARGGLVDTCALLEALDNGWLAGAGLDVIEGEEIISEEKQLLRNDAASQESLRLALMTRELLRRTDLVVTPHIAFDSREASLRILDTTIANIQAFRADALQNEVHT